MIEGNKKGSKFERPKGILAVEKRKHPRSPVRPPPNYWETANVVQGGLVADISEVGLALETHSPKSQIPSHPFGGGV